MSCCDPANSQLAQRPDVVVVGQTGCGGGGCSTPQLSPQMDPRLLAIPGFTEQLYAQGIARVNKDVFQKKSLCLSCQLLAVALGLIFFGFVLSVGICAAGNCDKPVVACTLSGGMCTSRTFIVPSSTAGVNTSVVRYEAATSSSQPPCCQFYCCGAEYTDTRLPLDKRWLPAGADSSRDGQRTDCEVVQNIARVTPLGEALPNHPEKCDKCTRGRTKDGRGSTETCPTMSYFGYGADAAKVSGGEQSGAATFVMLLFLLLGFCGGIGTHVTVKCGLGADVPRVLREVWAIQGLNCVYFAGSKHAHARLTISHQALASASARGGTPGQSADATAVAMVPIGYTQQPMQATMRSPMLIPVQMQVQQPTMQVQVPVGSQPGTLLQATAPDGQLVQFTVPHGAQPGQMLTIATPAPVVMAATVPVATVNAVAVHPVKAMA